MADDVDEKGSTYTVGCRLDKLVPNAQHVDAIRVAVERMQRVMVDTCDLMNLYIRDRLQNHEGSGLEHVFERNWLLYAMNEVTAGSDRATHLPALTTVRVAHMGGLVRSSRTSLRQLMSNQRTNLAAVASTNIWLHFRARLVRVVTTAMRLPKEEYDILSTDERKERAIQVRSIAVDIIRPVGAPYKSAEQYHAVVDARRNLLGIDEAVGEWGEYPFLYHIKSHPERFLRATWLLSRERETQLDRHGNTCSGFALFPLRRHMVPRHIDVCQQALREVLRLGTSEYAKQSAREKRGRECDACEPGPSEDTDAAPAPARRKRTRRPKADVDEEKRELFGQVVDLRAAGVAQKHRFAWRFTTDGVCARLLYKRAHADGQAPAGLPKRGMWTIDQIKHMTRSTSELHIAGVDPGKREIVVAVDMDQPVVDGALRAVRYTLEERQRDQRLRQYTDDMQRSRPSGVVEWQARLSAHNSRSTELGPFAEYCASRRDGLDEVAAFYATLRFRQHRWKRYIKTQKSEEKLYKKLRAMHKKDDERAFALAYGAWGLVAGVSSGFNRGNPPCIGVGMLRKLAKRFLVVITPEHYTSKTCCKCHSPMGAWHEVEQEMNRKIRGLRVCQNETCRMPQNRDKAGGVNIGCNCIRLLSGRPAIRSCTPQDVKLISLQVELEG